MTNVARDVRMTQEEKEQIRDNVERALNEAAQRQYNEQQRAVSKLQPVPEEESEEGENYTRDVVPLHEMEPYSEDVEIYLRGSERINYNLEEIK